MGQNQNSFREELANLFTPGDGYVYEGGTLINEKDKTAYTGDSYDTAYGKFGRADSSATGREGYSVGAQEIGEAPSHPITGGTANNLPGSWDNKYAMGLGALVGGPLGALAGYSGNALFPRDNAGNNSSDVTIETPPLTFSEDGWAKIPNYEGKKGLGSLGKDISRLNPFKGSLSGEDKATRDQRAAAAKYNNDLRKKLKGPDGGDDNVAAPATKATAPTTETNYSNAAKLGEMKKPPPDWVNNAGNAAGNNPSAADIMEYTAWLRNQGAQGMALGGEIAQDGGIASVLGGNEKNLINDAERAIRGELDENSAAIVLAQYVQQYGEDALRDLVDSVRSGEAQETRDRFARGENGRVGGNGNGSGTDDKVPAKLKEGNSEQDVLLAENEFVLRADAADSIEKMYGGGMLDKVNDAGSDAAKVLKKYLPA